MTRASLGPLVVLFLAGCGAAGPKPSSPPKTRALAAPRVVPGDLDARLLLGELPARASRLGAGPATIVASGEMVEGERFGAFVEIPAEACLLAYGRASSSMEDVDIAAFADEGNPVASDEGPDPRPTLLICPPHPERVYLAAHAASGEGLVVVGAQLVPRERAAEVGQATGARGGWGGEGPRAAEAWPGLDDRVRAHRSLLGGMWEEFRRVAVGLDARTGTFVSFPIEADQCIDMLLVPDETVALLEAEVMDGEGRVIARAHEGGTERTVTVCSPIAFNGSISIRPHIGRGLAAVVLSRARGEVARDLAARPDVAWVAPALPLDATRAARNAALAKAGYGAPTQSTQGTLQMGRRAAIAVDLNAAGCARIDIVAGQPLALIEANVWEDGALSPRSAAPPVDAARATVKLKPDPALVHPSVDSSALVTSGEGSNAVTLFTCAHAKGRLELETRGRPGPYAVLVRKERWQDPVFSKHPLAAARMLSRAADGPAMVHEGAPVEARALALEGAKSTGWEETIAPGRCLRVAAGTQGEGTGIEARLFDAGGEEIDRSHGANAVSVRGCAPAAAARVVRVELRATSGKLDAVVGVRSGG